MSLLEEIIAEASSAPAPVAGLLRKVTVLGSRTGTESLSRWVNLELNGYPPSAPLPPYRGPFPSDAKGDFITFGGTMRNAPISAYSFPEEMRHSAAFTLSYNMPISEIQVLAESGTAEIAQLWPDGLVGLVNRMVTRNEVALYEGAPHLTRAWKPISPASLHGLVDQVRSRVLDTALAFERLNPDLGNPRSELVVPREGELIVQNNIYGGNVNLAQASSAFNQNNYNNVLGNEEELLREMAVIGVTKDARDELVSALAADREGAERTEVSATGTHVNSWLGKLVSGAGGMLRVTATTTASSTAIALIKAHLGIP